MSERLCSVQDFDRLPAAAWQHLASGHPALRLEVLQALATTTRSLLPMQIFMLEDDSGIAAAAACELVAPDAPRSALDNLLYGRAVSMAVRLGASSRPTLLFRTPVGTECPFLVRPEAPAEQYRILSSLLDQIESRAADQGSGVAVLGVPDDEAILRSALLARQYLSTAIQPSARLPIEWADFDGYVRHLQSRSQRSAHNARRERNRSRQSGLSVRQLHCTVADAEALYRFSRDHYQHKNGTDPAYDPEFLPQLSTALGPDFLAFEARREGRRVGMLGGVRSGPIGWIAWYGAEIDRPNDFTYANLVFYHPAAVASALGLKTLLYGTHALDAKRRRGCRILGSHLYYRPHRPLARLLARSYFLLHRAWSRRKLQ